jgi:hypothetical protein
MPTRCSFEFRRAMSKRLVPALVLALSCWPGVRLRRHSLSLPSRLCACLNQEMDGLRGTERTRPFGVGLHCDTGIGP